MNLTSLSVHGKQLILFIANGKTGVFKRKFIFWNTYICHFEPDSFPVLKGFVVILGFISMNVVVLILC